jgi:hypothetical protein
MSTTTTSVPTICAICKNDERIHYYSGAQENLVVRCGACGWRQEVTATPETFRQWVRRILTGGAFLGEP